MPDVDVSILDFTTATVLTSSDLLYLGAYDSVGDEYNDRKTTLTTLANGLLNTFEFPLLLDTTSKTIIGAINEIASGGGGTASILTGTTPPTPEQGEDGNLYVQYTEGAGGDPDVVDAFFVKLDGDWVEIETSEDAGAGTKLTGTLEAGETSIVFSDEAITTNSLIDVYTETGIAPTAYTVAAGQLTLTFASQLADVDVVVLIDARGSEESGSSLHEYSTTEHKVGTWVDGSDVYEITLDLNQTLSPGETTLYHGISNLDKCISIVACCTYNNGSEWLYLPYLSPAYVSSYSVAIGNVNASTYKINVGSLFTSIENIYVTLQYTKTV